MKIRYYLPVLIVAMFCVQTLSAQTKIDIKPAPAKQKAGSPYGCLPPEVRPDTIIDVKTVRSRVGIRVIKETVVQRLNKIGARCKGRKLLEIGRAHV